MVEESVWRQIIDNDMAGKQLRDGPEPPSPTAKPLEMMQEVSKKIRPPEPVIDGKIGLDLLETLKNFEAERVPKLSLACVRPDDILLLQFDGEQEGKVRTGEFLVVRPATRDPIHPDPASYRSAEVMYLKGDVLDPTLYEEKLAMIGSTFGGSSLMAATLTEQTWPELRGPDNAEILLPPVRAINVLRKVPDGEYVSVSPDQLRGYPLKEGAEAARFQQVDQLFKRVEAAAPEISHEVGRHTFWQSADGGDLLYPLIDDEGELDEIALFSAEKQAVFVIAKHRGDQPGEGI